MGINALLAATLVCAWPALPEPGDWPRLPEPEQVAVAWPEATSVEVELLKPPPAEVPAESTAWRKGEDGKLVRLPGPAHRWPHQGCLMCLGIHIRQTHRIPQDKLDELGHQQWDVLHCNLHNEKTQTKAGGCSGGACSSPSRTRWRGRFR